MQVKVLRKEAGVPRDTFSQLKIDHADPFSDGPLLLLQTSPAGHGLSQAWGQPRRKCNFV